MRRVPPPSTALAARAEVVGIAHDELPAASEPNVHGARAIAPANRDR